MELAPGTRVDRYTVVQRLGEGGMAVVYAVRHNTLETIHALKVLTLASTRVRERLVQEGRLQARLRHPNVVAVTDVFEVGGVPALLMERVEGPALDAWLRDHRPSVAEAEALFRQVVDGVSCAHDLDIVHRDLKPGNVLLAGGPEGLRPKVTDFGLAKILADVGGPLHRTRTGLPMGTPAYMAPEQVTDAKHVDQRADIFSLGCILYELVCAQGAFLGENTLQIFNAVASGRYIEPRTLIPDLPPRISQAIAGALEVDRERRIPSCRALLGVLDGEPFHRAAPRTAVPPSTAGDTFALSHLDEEGPFETQPSGGSGAPVEPGGGEPAGGESAAPTVAAEGESRRPPGLSAGVSPAVAASVVPERSPAPPTSSASMEPWTASLPGPRRRRGRRLLLLGATAAVAALVGVLAAAIFSSPDPGSDPPIMDYLATDAERPVVAGAAGDADTGADGSGAVRGGPGAPGAPGAESPSDPADPADPIDPTGPQPGPEPEPESETETDPETEASPSSTSATSPSEGSTDGSGAPLRSRMRRKGTVEVVGDARSVTLIDRWGVRREPGEVPAGIYTVEAVFDSGVTIRRTDLVRVRADRTTRIRCSGLVENCQ